MDTPLIETKELVKRYEVGEVITHALDGVSITVAQGEFVAIDGKSGSGKSTLLHLLSLLDHPTSGALYVSGEDTSNFSRERRVEMRLSTFGYVFQDYALIPELTAIENVILPHFMHTGVFDDCVSRATELLNRVGLGKRLHNRPSQLSGGEQQRVAIARAMVNNPQVLFADEPTANLDSDTSDTIISILTDLHRQGITVLMVTHEPEYAQKAQRIITLADGKVI